jgi:hypothetical protein
MDVERVPDVVNSDRIYRHSSAQAEEIYEDISQ